jgi:hypothetical protein
MLFCHFFRDLVPLRMFFLNLFLVENLNVKDNPSLESHLSEVFDENLPVFKKLRLPKKHVYQLFFRPVSAAVSLKLATVRPPILPGQPLLVFLSSVAEPEQQGAASLGQSRIRNALRLRLRRLRSYKWY